MPSGLTYEIEKGQSFNDFVMGCAKQMGACISMRDMPSNTPIPEEFKISDYYKIGLEEAKKELEEFYQLTEEDWRKAAQKEFDEKIKSRKESEEKNILLKQKYETMIKKVEFWEPPGKDHYKFKEFMLKQLDDSIKWDCHDYSKNDSPTLLTGLEWKKRAEDYLVRTINVSTESYENECRSIKNKNKWIKDLRDSLKN